MGELRGGEIWRECEGKGEKRIKRSGCEDEWKKNEMEDKNKIKETKINVQGKRRVSIERQGGRER